MPAAAGQAEVQFVKPETYRDAGFGEVETRRTTDALSRHLQALAARRLPADQTLKIDVLDVDLAGEPTFNTPLQTRVVRGGADWPQIKLRYTLEAAGRTLASGEETVVDTNYAWQAGRQRAEGPYGYELKLLDRWFESHFKPAPRR